MYLKAKVLKKGRLEDLETALWDYVHSSSTLLENKIDETEVAI